MTSIPIRIIVHSVGGDISRIIVTSAGLVGPAES